MEDREIIDLYWQRDESAITETSAKYGRFCYSIAHSILDSREDSEECVNDTYLGAWRAMPPHKPDILSAFLGKITRRLSLKKWRARSAARRGGGSAALSMTELEDCIPDGRSIDEHIELSHLTASINTFLSALPDNERRIFLRRYWYFDSIDAICARFGFGKSKVKMTLKRTRDRLRAHLEKEGFVL